MGRAFTVASRSFINKKAKSAQLGTRLRKLDKTLRLGQKPSITAPGKRIDSFLECRSAAVKVSRDKRDVIQRIPGFGRQFLEGPFTAFIHWAIGRDGLDKNEQWMFRSE